MNQKPFISTELKPIKAAREYLETVPSGERAELIARQRWVQEHGANPAMRALAKSTDDMLEADVSLINEGNKAQQATDPSCPSCQSPGLMYECVYCSANSYPKGFVQQAKRVPMTEDEITNWYASENGLEECNMSYYPDFEKVVRSVERRCGIGGDV